MEQWCLAAVNNSGFALKFVPESLKTEEICIAAVNESIRAIKYVPDELLTREFLRSIYKKQQK